jgi:hypothetical protein
MSMSGVGAHGNPCTVTTMIRNNKHGSKCAKIMDHLLKENKFCEMILAE